MTENSGNMTDIEEQYDVNDEVTKEREGRKTGSVHYGEKG